MDEQTEHKRLLEELDKLEETRRTLNLRDTAAINECQRKINRLRSRIALVHQRRDNSQ